MTSGAAPNWFHLFLDVPGASFGEAVAFWSAATGWTVSEPRGDDGQFVTLLPDRGSAWLKMQAIDEAPRIHLDLDAPDRAGAVARSVALGATPQWAFDDVQVMRSPGGLLFCHTLGEGPQRFARSDDERALDQVCIDIPAPLWEPEVEFWRAVTGRVLEPGRLPEFAFLGDPDPHGGLRILLQRLDSSGGPVRAHPDIATADRSVEMDRHVALGAEKVVVRERWTVMRAPYGQVYCLTERNPVTGRVAPTASA